MPTIRTTEDRVTVLEQDFKISNYKLDTLIDSVKEVNEVVKKLADVSYNQSLFHEKLLNLYKDHKDLELAFNIRAEKTDKIIEEAKGFKAAAKVWGTVGLMVFTLIQGVAYYWISAAKQESDLIESRISAVEKIATVNEIRIGNLTYKHQTQK